MVGNGRGRWDGVDMNPRRGTVAAAMLGAALMLVACASPTPAPSPSVSTGPTAAPSPTGGVLDWWVPQPLDVGELIGSGSSESWTIEVYQFATSTTAFSETVRDCPTVPYILKGAPTVLVNIVYRYTGDEPVELSSGSVGSATDLRAVPDENCVFEIESEGGLEPYRSAGFAERVTWFLPVSPSSPNSPPYRVKPGEVFSVPMSVVKWIGVLPVTIEMRTMIPGSRGDRYVTPSEFVRISLQTLQ
jgi:hypothetical protein